MRVLVQWIGMAFLAVATLGGCGESGSSSTPTATGVFADAPVQGVKYVFGNYSGFTGAGGTFTYPVGMQGTFRVGDIVIGTATGSPLVTVVDLIKSRHPEYTDQQAKDAALNIVRFLTSIGGDPQQELLEIQRDVFDAAKGGDFGSVDLLGLSDTELQALLDRLGTFVLSTPEDARTHLENTLANVALLPHVGTYIAEDWNGAAFIEVFVSPDGSIYGAGTNDKGAYYSIRGSVLSTGAVSFETRDYSTKYYDKAVSKTLMAVAPSTLTLSTGTSDGKGAITGTVLEQGPFSEKTFPFVLRRIANPLDGYVGLYRGWFTDEYDVASFAFGVNTSGKIVGWAGASTSVAPLSGKVDVLTGEFSFPCGYGVMTGTLSGVGVEGTYSGPGDVNYVFTGDRMTSGSPK
jgi:hypothetical protein